MNAVKGEAKGASFREVHRSWTKIFDGVRRGGYVSRMSYREQQSAHARARLITGENNREAGRTIIAIMFRCMRHDIALLRWRDSSSDQDMNSRLSDGRPLENDAHARAIINEWESSPESVKAEGVGSDLIRVIRRLALVEQRLKLVEKEINSLQESELYELKSKSGRRGA